MARPASQQNAGYFPTPRAHWENIVSLFFAHQDARGLDPFAGSDDADNGGHFFRTFTEALPMEAYVNELQRERADTLVPLFGKKRVACGGAEELFAPHDFVSFLYLNPPYDYDKGGEERLELNLMSESWKWLQPSGIAAIVIYKHHLTDKAVAWIATRMESLAAFALPGKHLGEYDQIIIVGIKPDGKRRKEDKHATAEWLKVERDNLVMLDTPLAQPMFKIPAAVMPSEAVYFRSKEVDPMQVMAALQSAGNTQGTGFRDLIWQSDGDRETSSVHELRHRHLAVAVGSGAVDNIVVETEEHGRATIKAIKKMVQTCFYTGYDAKGNVTMKKFRHAVEVTFGLLNEVGDVIELEGDPEVLPFIAANATAMKERIDAAVTPLYQWDFAGRRRELLNVRLGEKAEFPLYHAQRHAIGMAITGLKHKKGVMLCASMGTGKAQPLSAKILTVSGWKLMGDIETGDTVISVDGKPAVVTGVFPQGQLPIYRVTFSDGSSTETCDEHLWSVYTATDKAGGKPYRVKSLREIMDSPLAYENGNRKNYIPVVSPVEFPERNLSIAPYIMGALLGDGSLTDKGQVAISSADADILGKIAALLPEGVTVNHNAAYDYRLSRTNVGLQSRGTGRTVTNPITQAIREMGLAGSNSATKFIPQDYLLGSVEQRLELLRGLLDTDGSVVGTYGIEYTTISRQLASDLMFLVQSLGGTVTENARRNGYSYNGERRVGQLSYRLHIKLPSNIQPFSLSRKADLYKPQGKYEPSRSIVSIEYVGEKDAQCIMVDHPSHLYVTDDFIVTHNTSMSATAAMQVVAHVASSMDRNKITIVVTPPQLPEKWLRELAWQSATGEKIMARRADHLDELREVLAEMATFDGPKFLVVKRDMMSLGGGVVGAVVWREGLSGKKGETDRERFVYPTCPECGHRLADDKEVDFEADYFDSGKRECSACFAPLWVKERRLTKLEKQQGQTKYELLGELLGHQYPVMTFPDLTHRFPESGMYVCDGHYNERLDSAIVRLVGDKLGLLVWDEIHEAKAVDSGRGEAFLRTANSAEKILVLTGTPVNGYASSTYNVEYAINPLMYTTYPRGGSIRLLPKGKAYRNSRGEFVNNLPEADESFEYSKTIFPASMRRWIDTMGVRISVEMYGKNKPKDTGAATGTSKKAEVTPPEGPGITADLIMWMAKHTINFYLHDLGSALPEMDEQIYGVDLPSDVLDAYKTFEGIVQNYVDLHKDLKTPRWASVASQLTNWAFCWPNDPRREWEIWHEYVDPLFKNKVKTLVATCPGFPDLELTPKEAWLLEDMRNELAKKETLMDGTEVEGRPYIVYVQQSGKTDIQPHLMNLIKKYVPDAKPFLLRSTTMPEKREAVINAAVKAGHNVLVCNARLVETGLDLIQFRNITVYEIVYSLTTLIQSTNRCYRLSQKSPLCRVNHLYFNATVENKAIKLMSTKKRAHSALTGLAMIGLDNLTNEVDDKFNMEEEIAKAYSTGAMEAAEDAISQTPAMILVNQMDAQFMNRNPELSLPMEAEVIVEVPTAVVYAVPAVAEVLAPVSQESEEALRVVRRHIAALKARMAKKTQPVTPVAPELPGRDWKRLSLGL